VATAQAKNVPLANDAHAACAPRPAAAPCDASIEQRRRHWASVAQALSKCGGHAPPQPPPPHLGDALTTSMRCLREEACQNAASAAAKRREVVRACEVVSDALPPREPVALPPVTPPEDKDAPLPTPSMPTPFGEDSEAPAPMTLMSDGGDDDDVAAILARSSPTSLSLSDDDKPSFRDTSETWSCGEKRGGEPLRLDDVLGGRSGQSGAPVKRRCTASGICESQWDPRKPMGVAPGGRRGKLAKANAKRARTRNNREGSRPGTRRFEMRAKQRMLAYTKGTERVAQAAFDGKGLDGGSARAPPPPLGALPDALPDAPRADPCAARRAVDAM